MTIEEKLRLVEDLWDEIAGTPDAIPIPDWQKEELARRKVEHLRDPKSGSSWSEVQERIRNRDGR
jgi:putative addiction module component (TIGR02574 family)